MSDQDMDRLREFARPLKFEADDAMVHRVRAAVAERVQHGGSVLDLLAIWFRPVATVIGTLLVILVIALGMQQSSSSSIDLLALTPSYGEGELYLDTQ